MWRKRAFIGMRLASCVLKMNLRTIRHCEHYFNLLPAPDHVSQHGGPGNVLKSCPVSGSSKVSTTANDYNSTTAKPSMCKSVTVYFLGPASAAF